MRRWSVGRIGLFAGAAAGPHVAAAAMSAAPSNGPALLANWSQPLLDRERLDELRGVLGGERVLQLLLLFDRQLRAQPATIRAAVGRSDLAAAAAEAHSLKGAALSIGGASVGHIAAALELGLGGSPVLGADQLHLALAALDDAVAATLAILTRELPAEPLRAA